MAINRFPRPTPVRLMLPVLLFLAALLSMLSVPADAAGRRDLLTEDSLQSLVAQEPENPDIWIELGTLAGRNGQIDLAKGYFDEAIKLSGRTGATILQIGDIWLSLGKVKTSLTYLMPNLSHLDTAQLNRLQAALEREKLTSAQLTVLRALGTRSNAYLPYNRKTAALAQKLGDGQLALAVLIRFYSTLDYESARNLLLLNFFLNGNLEPKAFGNLAEKYPQGEIGVLAHLNYAMVGKWGPVRDFLKREAASPSYRDYYHLLKGMEAAAEERNEEAAEEYQKALENSWEKLKVVILAELYRLYGSTGNKFKSDQVWESLKEDYQDLDPDLLEFLAKQLQARGYEKQAKYFYRVVLRRRPGNIPAITALWEDLLGADDEKPLEDNIKALLDRDALSCEGNMMAMNFHLRKNNDKDLLPYARNSTVYCFDAVEPYYVLGTALLNLSKPDEARVYFATFIRKGGDVNRVPVSVR